MIDHGQFSSLWPLCNTFVIVHCADDTPTHHNVSVGKSVGSVPGQRRHFFSASEAVRPREVLSRSGYLWLVWASVRLALRGKVIAEADC